MNPQTQLTKKERKTLKREEKEGIKKVASRMRFLKRVVLWGFGATVIIMATGGVIWYIATRPPTPESDIVSRNGLHWHPELVIYVKGVKQKIPANLGVGVVETPVHTHEDDGIIHLEFSGLVQKSDIALGQFFKNWGKDMRSFGSNMKMTVNGEENTVYENYIMKDKDRIELRYE